MVEENKDKIIVDSDVKEIEDILVVRGKPLSRFRRAIKKKDNIIDALKLVFDPEISVDVYNLGLIYDIEILKNGDVNIVMTLTSPTCPMADEIPVWVADSVASVEGVGVVNVKVVWDPVWDLSKMSEEAKFQMELGDLDFSFLHSYDFE